MVYLKTIFSAPSEIKFLKLNLREAFDHIDAFVVCEFNRTHIGKHRDLLFKSFLNQFSEEERGKIIYVPGDISRQAVEAEYSNVQAHWNERLMRGYFATKIPLKKHDVVFSVDADEIIFGYQYERILEKLSIFHPAYRLRLHQFYYRMNYLWENNEFIAPTVCYAWYYAFRYPGQWRYAGKLYKETAGCHFSWCLSIDDMINKLDAYAHHYEYGHLARPEILKKAVKEKIYPFDSSVDFRIRVLDPHKDPQYYPKSFFKMWDEFSGLILKE